MRHARRFERLAGIATVVAGVAALAYAGGALAIGSGGCAASHGPASCRVSRPHDARHRALHAESAWSRGLFGLVGFAILDSSSRRRGALPFLWVFALLLAAAAGVALLPLYVAAAPLPELPSGVLFVPSVALGVATAVLGTLGARTPREQRVAR